MSWFRPVAAPPDLDDVVECRYVAVSAGHHDLLPDGCVDVVWTAGRGVMACGPDTAGWSFDMPAGVEMAGVRFRAGAVSSVLGVAANELVDRQVPLADLLGAREARLLGARLEDAGDDAGRLAAFDDLVRSRREAAGADPTIEMARLLAADPGTSVDALAARAGLSARQLRRRFDKAVGYGPAFLARVARLQRFAKGAVLAPTLGIAELAVAAGYADQSHLAKDTRALAERTPRELIGALAGSSLAVGDELDGRSVQDGGGSAGARWAA